MLIAWKDGLYFNVAHATVNPSCCKLALIHVVCDIPACQKLGGSQVSFCIINISSIDFPDSGVALPTIKLIAKLNN